MRYGLTLPPFGDQYGDIHYLARMAREAEDAGWDGFFIWDHILFDPSGYVIPDIMIALAAIAMNTRHIRLGALVTALPRRRPWKMARETVSIDRLSHGRLIVGVGLGEPPTWDYGFFGEETEAVIRAQKLDEGLDILNGLWSGQPYRHAGQHYQLQEMIFRPTPVQQPRIPIWVGGNWDKPRPQRRAARWDGYMPLKWGGILTPDEWKGIMAYVNQHRASAAPFDWVHGGSTPGDDRAGAAAIVQPYADIGITWWVESVDPWRFGNCWEEPIQPGFVARMDERIRQGPPRL